MDIKNHKNKFEKIVEKYNLKDESKAGEIANFLTKARQEKVSAKEFSKLFNMDEEDAVVFLSFIQRGLEFKENHIDKK